MNYKFHEGGIWELKDWIIDKNHKVDLKYCRHCMKNICPRVVIAFNEGGENSTGVCLDCILEAAAQLPLESNGRAP
jgi:hypothetical protein